MSFNSQYQPVTPTSYEIRDYPTSDYPTSDYPTSDHPTSDLDSLLHKSLPPKQLSRWTKGWNIVRHLIVSFLAFGVLSAAIIYGIRAYWWYKNQVKTAYNDGLCNKQAASANEQRFVIDIRFGGNFTFTQAKMIDIAWDLVIGQGGWFVHALLLCRYVVADQLVWMMEHSTIPYDYYISLCFSTLSLSPIWSLGKALKRRLGWRASMSAVWMAFAIAYVLVFPTIWGAATGYISPRSRVYQMPDQALVSLTSEDLAICWYLDDSRLGWSDGHIEMGPTFKAMSDNHKEWLEYNYKVPVYYNALADFDLEYLKPKLKTSDAFRDIYAYALSITDIHYFLNQTGFWSQFYDTALTGVPVSDTFNMHNSTDSAGHTIVIKSLPKTLKGWQYSGIGQEVEFYGENPKNNAIAKYATTFTRDDTVQSGPGVVPYDSFFWFNGVGTELSAPFLELGGKCTAHNNFFTSLGACVCYRGEPIPYDWYTDENMFCISQRGYVWGFSSFLTLIGLALEAIWVFGCWAVWLDANVNSNLLKHRRRGFGVLRNVLDIAESINRDLGDKTCAYSDKELEVALRNCDRIGFSVDNKGQSSHIGIVSEGLRQRPQLNTFLYYGTAGG